MLKSSLSTILFLFASIAQAYDCDPAFQFYWHPIEQTLEAPSPWKGYRPSEVLLVAVDANRTVYVRNIPESIVRKIDSSAEVCSNLLKVIKLSRVASHKVEAYEIYPYTNAQAHSADLLLQTLANELGKTFVVLGAPSNSMFEPPSTWVPMNWIWAVHEPFHLYQHEVFQKSVGSGNLAECENQSGWREFLVSEFEDWKKIGPLLSNQSQAPVFALQETLKRILERRESIAKDKLLPCLQLLRMGERIEGTARYVDIHARMNARSLDNPKRWEQELLPILSIDPNRPFPYTQIPYFYSTGALWCEALDGLGVTDWQNRVEAGDTPEVVVRTRFLEMHSQKSL